MTHDPDQKSDAPPGTENQNDPTMQSDTSWVMIIAAVFIIYTALFVGLAIYGA